MSLLANPSSARGRATLARACGLGLLGALFQVSCGTLSDTGTPRGGDGASGAGGDASWRDGSVSTGGGVASFGGGAAAGMPNAPTSAGGGGASSGGASSGGASSGGASSDGASSGGAPEAATGESGAGGDSNGGAAGCDAGECELRVWTRQFGTAEEDGARAVAVDANGNVYVAGIAGDALPGESRAGGSFDAFVRKYDSSGRESWTRQFGSTGSDAADSVAVDGSGNVYVAGIAEAALPGQESAGAWDVFVRKYDGAGHELWTREFGSNGYDVGRVAVDAAGNAYVSGVTEYGLPGQPIDADAGASADGGPIPWTYAFIWKYDASGTEVFTRQFGSGLLSGAANVDASGNAYFVGSTEGTLPGQTSAGEGDAFVRKYDGSGAELWTRQFGSSSDDTAESVSVDENGNVYVAGITHGSLPGQTSSGEADAFVQRYDGSGAEVWTRQFGTAAADIASQVRVAPGGLVYVAGSTNGTLPGQTSFGSTDAFVRRYDGAGNELVTLQFGTIGLEQVAGFAVGGGALYLSGETDGAFPGPGNTNRGSFDAFVAKIVP
jgi:hypothetical protein